MNEEKNWAVGTLLDVPFWRNDMQPAEYDIERVYWKTHWSDFEKGTYEPLWKQKLNDNPNYEENYRKAKELSDKYS